MEQPSLPERSDRCVEDRYVVRSLTARLVNGYKSVLNIKSFQFEIARTSVMTEVCRTQSLGVVPPYRAAVCGVN